MRGVQLAARIPLVDDDAVVARRSSGAAWRSFIPPSGDPEFRTSVYGEGESVNYALWGTGRPLVYIPPWGIGNAKEDFAEPSGRALFGRLARGRMLVALVRRSVAMRANNELDISLDAQVRDLEVVVDQFDSEAVDIWALDDGCAIGLTFAARFPERVRRLVLWGAYARTRGASDPAVQALVGMARTNWALARRSFAELNLPSGSQAMKTWFADYHQRSFSAEGTAKFLEFAADIDLRETLSRVISPTLLFHREGDCVIALHAAQSVASRIRNASIRVLPGDIHVPYFGDTSYIVELESFLDEPRGVVDEDRPLQGRSAIILFLDIVDSTGITERLGDSAFHKKSSALQLAVRRVLQDAGGRVVEGRALGDGVMAVFEAAKNAIVGALDCRRQAQSLDLLLHLGIHAGDVIWETNDVHGGAVNIAARVCAASAPGELLVSDVVRGLARTSSGVRFEDRGEFALKGIEDELRLFAVHERQDSLTN